jgi:REP element-mobilizing transposase RayT
VLVTQYRRPTWTPALLEALREALAAILADGRWPLIECGGEADPAHRLIRSHPALHISPLINNRTSASTRRLRNRLAHP